MYQVQQQVRERLAGAVDQASAEWQQVRANVSDEVHRQAEQLYERLEPRVRADLQSTLRPYWILAWVILAVLVALLALATWSFVATLRTAGRTCTCPRPPTAPPSYALPTL